VFVSNILATGSRSRPAFEAGLSVCEFDQPLGYDDREALGARFVRRFRHPGLLEADRQTRSDSADRFLLDTEVDTPFSIA
jgi:hypothetical protein